MRLLSEVFETSASASSANPPTSPLDHKKADPKTSGGVKFDLHRSLALASENTERWMHVRRLFLVGIRDDPHTSLVVFRSYPELRRRLRQHRSSSYDGLLVPSILFANPPIQLDVAV